MENLELVWMYDLDLVEYLLLWQGIYGKKALKELERWFGCGGIKKGYSLVCCL